MEFPHGSPANPLPDDQLIAKFRDLADTVLRKSQIDEIENSILQIDRIPDVRRLPVLLSTAK